MQNLSCIRFQTHGKLPDSVWVLPSSLTQSYALTFDLNADSTIPTVGRAHETLHMILKIEISIYLLQLTMQSSPQQAKRAHNI